MRPTRQLRKLARSALRQLAGFEYRVRSISPTIRPRDERELALTAIDLHNLWALFSRQYFLSCAIETWSSSGTRIFPQAVTFPSLKHALAFACDEVRGGRRRIKWRKGVPVIPREEIVWHRPTNILRLSSAAAFSNLRQIHAAFSIQTRVFDDLRDVRNFFAHRNANTAATVRVVAARYSLPSRIKPAVLLRSVEPGVPFVILRRWIIDIRNVVLQMTR